jgi:glyoxylase-like metal-dependent hydrolase (beta-lactamase superfamily II)
MHSASAKMPQRPALPQWESGGVSLTRIVESEEPLLSPFELLPDCTPNHINENLSWLAPRFYDPQAQLLVITIQSFLIRTAGKTILVDACSGDHKDRRRPFFHQREWGWLEKLEAAGVRPGDIDIVMCSHLHVDHVGWNTRLESGKWVPTFPNARYLISKREWEYWRSPLGALSVRRTGDFISDSVLPIIESGQVDLIDDRHGLCECIGIEPAHGHTPGQFIVRISAGRNEAILSADLMHTPLQLRYPQWSTNFCVDPNLARRTREEFLNRNCNGPLIFPAHFPSPCGGRIIRDGSHYFFEYADLPLGKVSATAMSTQI